MQKMTVEKVKQSAIRVTGTLPLYPKRQIEQEFQQTLVCTPGLKMLLLSTSDGRPVAEWFSLNADPRRLSAMTNSFLTLGETVASELAIGSANYVTIHTPNGQMVLIRLNLERPLTLAALGAAGSNMAVVLFAACECASRIKQRLSPIMA